MVYKIGNKRYKTWDEYDDALRNLADDPKDWKDVKFTYGCNKCKKNIKGRPYGRDRKLKNGTIAFELYCKKCFGKYYHITLETNGRKKSSA